MAIGISRKRKLLDGKLCFDLWVEVGSLQKVAKVLRDRHGMVNPTNGKLFTPMGISESAWVYALENPLEGRKGVTEVWRRDGLLLSDRDWGKLVIDKARGLFGRKRLARFMAQHSYLTPYLDN